MYMYKYTQKLLCGSVIKLDISVHKIINTYIHVTLITLKFYKTRNSNYNNLLCWKEELKCH